MSSTCSRVSGFPVAGVPAAVVAPGCMAAVVPVVLLCPNIFDSIFPKILLILCLHDLLGSASDPSDQRLRMIPSGHTGKWVDAGKLFGSMGQRQDLLSLMAT